MCGEPAWKADTDVGARVPFVAYRTVTYDGGRVDRVSVFVLEEHQGTIKVSEGRRCGSDTRPAADRYCRWMMDGAGAPAAGKTEKGRDRFRARDQGPG